MDRRLKEFVAIAAIVDGAVGVAAPRRCGFLGRFGLKSYAEAMEYFADRLGLVPTLGVAEVGFGIWPALGQYPGKKGVRGWGTRHEIERRQKR